MQSFIIISKNREKAREFVKKMADERKVSKFDIYSYETEKAVGIGDVKSLSKQIFLKPMQGTKKIVVLEAFFGMTIDSQNAFLKVLEEPPLSTTIVILANSNFFLPTILSRCKLIELSTEINFEKNEELEVLKIFESLKTMAVGEKLKLAQDLFKDKENALQFIEKLIIVAREKMINNEKHRGEYKKDIEIMKRYYDEIKKSNVNLRLGLENMFLEI